MNKISNYLSEKKNERNIGKSKKRNEKSRFLIKDRELYKDSDTQKF